MTSTNEGKDVKSIQTSALKGKSHLIEFYKTIDAGLSTSTDLSQRVQFLCEAWRQVHHLCLFSVPDTQAHLVNWIQKYTARNVFQEEWRSPKGKAEHNKLKESIEIAVREVKSSLKGSHDDNPQWKHMLVGRGEWFLRNLENPWDQPVLKKQEAITAEEMLEWMREEHAIVFTMRLVQLTASKCDELALRLVSTVMERVRSETEMIPDVDEADEIKDKKSSSSSIYADTLSKEASFTKEVWHFLTDLEFVLLHKRNQREQCIKLAKQTPLREAPNLVKRLQYRQKTPAPDKKLWKNASEIATLIAQVVVVRCMVVARCSGVVQKTLYSCGRALAAMLGHDAPHTARALAAPAASATHLHTLADAHHAQSSEELKPFVCELYVRAITAGMNELEKLKLKTEKATEARSTEQMLALWFMQLSDLLSISQRMKCECVLTAFSVHPSPIMYKEIQSAPELPPVALDTQDPNEGEKTSEFGSWATDSRSQTNLVKTSETLNLKQTQHQANVLSTAILTEGEALGLSHELCQDITVLLSGPRVKTLSWDMDRQLLLENCRTYMDRTHGGTKALTTELKYLNLDPKAYQHLPEEDDNENDMFYGIEKGYEHLVEFQEDDEPEETWPSMAAYDDLHSPYSSNVESDFSGYRRKKKVKSVFESSEEEYSTLSIIAENKKKERPHSKERSKERSHSKDQKDKPKKEQKTKKKPKKEPKKSDATLDPLDISGLVEEQKKTKTEHKEKKKRIRKKKEEKIVPKCSSLSRLVGKKICKQFEKYKTASVTDSDYDSQGKCSINSLNSEGTEEVVFDGLYSMDDIKSPEKDIQSKVTNSNQLSFTNTINKTASKPRPNQAQKSTQSNPKASVTSRPVTKTEEKKPKSVLIEYRKQLDPNYGLKIHRPTNAAPAISNNSQTKPNAISNSSTSKPNAIYNNAQSKPNAMKLDSNFQAQIRPKPVAIPDIPKVFIDKNQSQKINMLNNEVNKILNRNHLCQPNLVNESLSYPNDPRNFQQNAYRSTQPTTDNVYNDPAKMQSQSWPQGETLTDKQFHTSLDSFVKELKETINAGAGVSSKSPPSTKNKAAARNTPNTTKPETKNKSAKQGLQNKSDNEITFSRLSYLHRNKQIVDSLIEYQDAYLREYSLSKDVNRLNENYKNPNQRISTGSKAEVNHQRNLNVSVQRKVDPPRHISSSNEHIRSLLNKPNLLVSATHQSARYDTQANIPIEKPENLTKHASQSSLSEKDDQDILRILRQQNHLNNVQTVLQKSTTTPNRDHINQIQSNTFINFASPSTVKLNNNRTELTNNKQSDKNFSATQNKEPEKKNKVTITDVQTIKPPCTKTSQTKNVTTPKATRTRIKAANQTAVIKRISNFPKLDEILPPPAEVSGLDSEDKPSTDWESVMNAIRAQKTPCRGPKALDVALNKSSIEQAFSEIEREQVNAKLKAMIEQNKLNNEMKANQTATSTDSMTTVSNIIPNTTSSDQKILISQPNVKVPKEISHQMGLPKKNPTESSVKQFTCPLPKDDDPFISGIENSDYDLIEALMDDDLRQEIGELSSDEEFNPHVVKKPQKSSIEKNLSGASRSPSVLTINQAVNPQEISRFPTEVKQQIMQMSVIRSNDPSKIMIPPAKIQATNFSPTSTPMNLTKPMNNYIPNIKPDMSPSDILNIKSSDVVGNIILNTMSYTGTVPSHTVPNIAPLSTDLAYDPYRTMQTQHNVDMAAQQNYIKNSDVSPARLTTPTAKPVIINRVDFPAKLSPTSAVSSTTSVLKPVQKSPPACINSSEFIQETGNRTVITSTAKSSRLVVVDTLKPLNLQLNSTNIPKESCAQDKIVNTQIQEKPILKLTENVNKTAEDPKPYQAVFNKEKTIKLDTVNVVGSSLKPTIKANTTVESIELKTKCNTPKSKENLEKESQGSRILLRSSKHFRVPKVTAGESNSTIKHESTIVSGESSLGKLILKRIKKVDDTVTDDTHMKIIKIKKKGNQNKRITANNVTAKTTPTDATPVVTKDIVTAKVTPAVTKDTVTAKVTPAVTKDTVTTKVTRVVTKDSAKPFINNEIIISVVPQSKTCTELKDKPDEEKVCDKSQSDINPTSIQQNRMVTRSKTSQSVVVNEIDTPDLDMLVSTEDSIEIKTPKSLIGCRVLDANKKSIAPVVPVKRNVMDSLDDYCHLPEISAISTTKAPVKDVTIDAKLTSESESNKTLRQNEDNVTKTIIEKKTSTSVNAEPKSNVTSIELASVNTDIPTNVESEIKEPAAEKIMDNVTAEKTVVAVSNTQKIITRSQLSDRNNDQNEISSIPARSVESNNSLIKNNTFQPSENKRLDSNVDVSEPIKTNRSLLKRITRSQANEMRDHKSPVMKLIDTDMLQKETTKTQSVDIKSTAPNKTQKVLAKSQVNENIVYDSASSSNDSDCEVVEIPTDTVNKICSQNNVEHRPLSNSTTLNDPTKKQNHLNRAESVRTSKKIYSDVEYINIYSRGKQEENEISKKKTFNPRAIKSSEIPQSFKDSFKIEHIGTDDQNSLKQTIRIKSPNGKTFKATIHGVCADFDTLFEEPSIRNILLNNYTDKKRFTLNFYQVAKEKTIKPQNNDGKVAKAQPVTETEAVETIVLSDDDDDDDSCAKMNFFKTKHGNYNVKISDTKVIDMHQKKFDQECRVNIVRHNIKRNENNSSESEMSCSTSTQNYSVSPSDSCKKSSDSSNILVQEKEKNVSEGNLFKQDDKQENVEIENVTIERENDLKISAQDVDDEKPECATPVLLSSKPSISVETEMDQSEDAFISNDVDLSILNTNEAFIDNVDSNGEVITNTTSNTKTIDDQVLLPTEICQSSQKSHDEQDVTNANNSLLINSSSTELHNQDSVLNSCEVSTLLKVTPLTDREPQVDETASTLPSMMSDIQENTPKTNDPNTLTPNISSENDIATVNRANEVMPLSTPLQNDSTTIVENTASDIEENITNSCDITNASAKITVSENDKSITDNADDDSLKSPLTISELERSVDESISTLESVVSDIEENIPSDLKSPTKMSTLDNDGSHLDVTKNENLSILPIISPKNVSQFDQSPVQSLLNVTSCVESTEPSIIDSEKISTKMVSEDIDMSPIVDITTNDLFTKTPSDNESNVECILPDFSRSLHCTENISFPSSPVPDSDASVEMILPDIRPRKFTYNISVTNCGSPDVIEIEDSSNDSVVVSDGSDNVTPSNLKTETDDQFDIMSNKRLVQNRDCYVKLKNCDKLAKAYENVVKRKCFINLTKCDYMVKKFKSHTIAENDLNNEETGRTSPVMEIYDMISLLQTKVPLGKRLPSNLNNVMCDSEWFATKRKLSTLYSTSFYAQTTKLNLLIGKSINEAVPEENQTLTRMLKRKIIPCENQSTAIKLSKKDQNYQSHFENNLLYEDRNDGIKEKVDNDATSVSEVPSGNVIETLKKIAEEIVLFNENNMDEIESDRDTDCSSNSISILAELLNGEELSDVKTIIPKMTVETSKLTSDVDYSTQCHDGVIQLPVSNNPMLPILVTETKEFSGNETDANLTTELDDKTDVSDTESSANTSIESLEESSPTQTSQNQDVSVDNSENEMIQCLNKIEEHLEHTKECEKPNLLESDETLPVTEKVIDCSDSKPLIENENINEICSDASTQDEIKIDQPVTMNPEEDSVIPFDSEAKLTDPEDIKLVEIDDEANMECNTNIDSEINMIIDNKSESNTNFNKIDKVFSDCVNENNISEDDQSQKLCQDVDISGSTSIDDNTDNNEHHEKQSNCINENATDMEIDINSVIIDNDTDSNEIMQKVDDNPTDSNSQENELLMETNEVSFNNDNAIEICETRKSDEIQNINNEHNMISIPEVEITKDISSNVESVPNEIVETGDFSDTTNQSEIVNKLQTDEHDCENNAILLINSKDKEDSVPVLNIEERFEEITENATQMSIDMSVSIDQETPNNNKPKSENSTDKSCDITNTIFSQNCSQSSPKVEQNEVEENKDRNYEIEENLDLFCNDKSDVSNKVEYNTDNLPEKESLNTDDTVGIFSEEPICALRDDDEFVIKGVEYQDPVVGTCYVFSIVGSPNFINETINDDLESENQDAEIEKLDIYSDDLIPQLNLTVPKKTYSKRNKDDLEIVERRSKRNLKRKLDLTDVKSKERKYRKGKNIDYPKFTKISLSETVYSKEYKRLFEYYRSIRFSYSRPYHIDHIEVDTLHQNWPIQTTITDIDHSLDFSLFEELEITITSDPLTQTLAEELLAKYDELDSYSSNEINETNFNMGFGEESGRVINLGLDVSKFPAATLSDVKQSQPILQSVNSVKNNLLSMKTIKDEQIENCKRYTTFIQLKNKIRGFFLQNTRDLSLNQEQYKRCETKECDWDTNELIEDLCRPDFFRPSPVDHVVQVVQVGQLPVSAAAQNPVTCDPRVTQVSNASPSQCSMESSPNDDPQSAIKTEYTELTTADLPLSLVHSYSQHNHEHEQHEEFPEIHVTENGLPITTELKSVVKIELVEEMPEEKSEDEIPTNNEQEVTTIKIENDVDYSYESSPKPDQTPSPVSTYQHEYTPVEQECEPPSQSSTSILSKPYPNKYEKKDQIAHAMTAAGIPTSPEPATSPTPDMMPEMCQGVGQTTSHYHKISAAALQQALAQILPSLNQANIQENGQQGSNASLTPQVLHIVKNAAGNQITLVDGSQQSVINATGTAAPVLHIVQNKGASQSNGTPGAQANTFSGLSLVDTGFQQGNNQLLHIVNTGSQNNNGGQVLKRVNLLTNLANVQGSGEQKIVQFVCKSADGKSIQLNAPHQRGMVLRLQSFENSGVQNNSAKTENQEPNQSPSPTSTASANDVTSQQEMKSRPTYEENYAQFMNNSAAQQTPESTCLPKFNQAFGKQIYQEENQKQDEITNNNSHIPSMNPENGECQSNENTINLEQMEQMNSPPLLLRKSSAQTTQTQTNLVQQIKQSMAPIMHGGVIYTRQIPVNIGGGQTINLITVPSSELEEQKQQQAEVKFVNQNEIDSPIIKIVPQTQTTSNGDAQQEENGGHVGGNAESTTPQPQPVLTQMRIKLPMLSKNPQVVSGARVVRPSFFQIQRNVIGGANQPVYQQLVLTAAPPLGQQTIRLPQAQTQATRTVKLPAENPSTSESQMSSSTLEQLREFDLVLEQVKERSTGQPNVTGSFSNRQTSVSESSDTPVSVSTSSTESSPQTRYSTPNPTVSTVYTSRKSSVSTTCTTTFVRSPDSSGIIDTPSSSHVQVTHTARPEPTPTPTETQTPTSSKPTKSATKPRSRPKASSNPPNTLKLPVPTKTSSQKPLEDEQTTQRILYILAEYKEQVENSPDKDKPAPRRRTNLPINPSSSKRRKGSFCRRHCMSPVQGEDSCRTMGSEDSSCGTSYGDCTENECIHSPQESPRKVVRRLTFEHDTPLLQQRPQPRNVILADGQTITLARGTSGKPATAVLMPANYILPVSMVKGGQQIAIVTNRGPKLLTVTGSDGATTNALLLQRLVGPTGLKPVLTRPGVRHVRLPASALHNLQAFNLATATTVQPPDSTPTSSTAPNPPELIDTRATSSPWAERDSQDPKPDSGSSPEGSSTWNLPTSSDPLDYAYEETVRTDNHHMDRTVLDSLPDRYTPDMEAQRIFDKMFDVDSKKSFMVDSQDDSPRCGYDLDTSDCDDKAYHQVVHRKDGTQRRLTHVSAAALRHKYAILEHELRLQKSLSEECEDLGVDSPSASELFPEAELLFGSSPAHDHTQDHHAHTSQTTITSTCIPQPDMDDQIATDHLLRPRESDHDDLGLGLEDVGIVTVSEDGMQATIALDQEEFARSHPNTTFHSEPTEEGEIQPFTIAGFKGRQITSTIFHANRAPATVLMATPQTTVISQATPDGTGVHNNIKYDIENMIDALPTHTNNISSVLVKDGIKYGTILQDNREIHISNASAIVHSTGNATQVIRRVRYEHRDPRYIEPGLVGDDSRDAALESMPEDDDRSSPERHADLFWESNSEGRRQDFSSDSDKCCKSPSYDSTDSSGASAHVRLDSVIKDARECASLDGHPPLRTYPAKRTYQESLSGKTRAGERRASHRGVVKRGCHCCTGESFPPRPKKPRPKKPTLDFATN